ncbi:death domain-associated protein 6-like [Amphibalanus amphitrite]|uniref:death domain-associated protein 6-like n=1 Tax=Amphibalanus amphitrite TaxID=1232801 RepID=UPI001C8FF068|nr:death domain-associated protein 6-like [Amphibalanus amphitrite]
MDDVIIISDDDYTPPAAQQHRKATSDSKIDQTAGCSLAAGLGGTKAVCRRGDDAEPPELRDRHLSTGNCSKSVADDRPARSRRPAGAIGGEEANPEPKCARLDSRCRGDQKTEETSESKPEPEPEQKPEPDPCKDGLEEVCALLKPLLSGPELKIEAKVRRRHAAVLAVTSGHPGRVQHLIGVTRQCAERLRAEPDRCFTVVRGFLEQLDQFKIVAYSAQSCSAPRVALKANAAADNTETAATDNVARAADKVDKSKKANLNDAPKASPSPFATVDGSAAPSEQNEREKRRHRRHVAKLEKTLRRLEREIVRQDKLEVDWDDAACSAYIVGARLKRRYVRVYRYYCRLVGATEEAEKLDWQPIRFHGTGYSQINRRIEKFVNRNREFPDFTDVLSLIKQANQHCRLHLGPTALHDQAERAFLQIGTLLQKQRRVALAESMDALTGTEDWRGCDPSATDPILAEKLAQSAAEGSKRLNEKFSDFVQRQESMAAERRMKRAESDKDEDGREEEENEDEDEDQEDDDTEESEVTDEELEANREEPAGANTFGLDYSDQEGVPMG